MSALWQVAPVCSADTALLVPTPTSGIIDGTAPKILHLHFPGLSLDSVMGAKVGLTRSLAGLNSVGSGFVELASFRDRGWSVKFDLYKSFWKMMVGTDAPQ